jgi:hypothetical protein
MKIITGQEPHLVQQSYMEEILSDSERNERIKNIANDLGNMGEFCRVAVCIPAYRESSLIRNTLENYTIHQKTHEGVQLDPETFEINILINRPNKDSERDMLMLEVIEQFCSEYPAYHINVAEVEYDFQDKAIMGLIFKDIADAVIVRNLARTVSPEEKARLVLRTAGADVEALNPELLLRTIKLFSDKSIIAHRGETRLPPQLLKAFPLLHVMQTFAVYLLRQYRGSETTNGPFSYTAEAYATVGGFDPHMKLSEEVDLAHRIAQHAEQTEWTSVFFCDDIKDVLNNPRRQVHALFGGIGMAGRYKNFGTRLNEDTVHNMSTSWRTICPATLPESCVLTKENLSRELSGYYRTYLRIAKANKIPLETIDIIFRRGFELCGITEYSTHKSSFMYDNHIEIHSIKWLLRHVKGQTLPWSKTFSQYQTENF